VADRTQPLLSHVEVELAVKVKRAADAAGMTASSYIRKVLLDHFAAEE